MPDPLLTLEHLSAGYTDAAGNTVPILRDVTLMVRAGSRVVLAPTAPARAR